jgi:uncharacterized membrane-anchored protein
VSRSLSQGAHTLLSKAPPATLMFWVVKICATTVGEAGGDAASMTLKLGYAVSIAIFAVFFAGALAVQLRVRRYHAAAYWLAVVATTTVGTVTSDFLGRTMHLGYVLTSAIPLVLVLAVLLAWRITAHDHAVKSVLWPALLRLLPEYPDITVEVVIDYGLTDIVAERYDAGIRSGEMVARDMVAVRIGPDMRMAVVGSPGYLAGREAPAVPQDLTAHRCINLRLPTLGGLYAWEFEKDGHALRVRVDGNLIFNGSAPMLEAALAGFGLAYVAEDMAQADIDAGRLVRVLEDWCTPYPGYHLYYPSRRQPTPAFAALVRALRWAG